MNLPTKCKHLRIYNDGTCADCGYDPVVQPHNHTNNMEPEQFTKHDQSKPNLAILFDTPTALSQVADVMSYGASKYSRKNWSLVDDKERYLAAAMRHLSAYATGELLDPESGLPHLSHATTSLLFLAELEQSNDT